MGLPDISPTDRQVLDWLNKDAGERVFCVAGSWYSRRGWNQPHRRHQSLHEAARHCMPDRHALPADPAAWAAQR